MARISNLFDLNQKLLTQSDPQGASLMLRQWEVEAKTKERKREFSPVKDSTTITDEKQKSLKYLVSKYTLLVSLIDKLKISKEDRSESGLQDEELTFIESKLIMEDLKRSISDRADRIQQKNQSIEELTSVGSP